MKDTNETIKFDSTFMAESNDGIYFDTSERILELSDTLAEEIIIENIKEQLEENLDVINDKINYISLFREKYSDIEPGDDIYDDEYIKMSIAKVGTVVAEKILERYGVELGDDLEFCTPEQYLEDMETLYEFLFIRHYINIVDYLKSKLVKNRLRFIESYKARMSEDANSKDLFVMQSKKKFKNYDDVLIIHFLSEILRDIVDTTESAYDLFRDIVDIDLYEEYNNRMSELLINYGNKIVINDDNMSAKLYMKPLENPTLFSEIRNSILMAYLEDCELEREEGK